MITIFRGRKLSLDGSEDVVYAQVAVALRDQIHHFNTGRNCNPFAVFMKIALHTDEYGWAFPSSASISAGTGISTAHALAAARAHLLDMRIDGHRVLAIYRQRRPDGTFGRHLYRIFPDAWPGALDHLPPGFDAATLSPLTPDHPADEEPPTPGPHAAQPHVDHPHAAKPHADHPHPKKNQLQKENQEKENQIKSGPGFAGIDPPTPRSGPGPPPIHGQPPPAETSTSPSPSTSPAFVPCDLARFIASHSGYRFRPGGQHDRLLCVVPHRGQAHPAPNDLYRDPARREAFQAWVLAKIAWAEGRAGAPKPLKALVSAMRNYEQPRFGWLTFWDRWSVTKEVTREKRGSPGPARWTGGAAGRPPVEAGDHHRNHWAQVACFLAGAGQALGQPQS